MALILDINSYIRRNLRLSMAILSAISGLTFLSQSSFFKLQFNDTRTSEILFFGIVSALLIFLVFMAPNWTEVLQKVWNLNFSAKLTVDCVFMGIVWLLAFLIKYPRFDVNSKYTKSCVSEEKEQLGNKASRRTQYGLVSLGAFSLLALLLSSETQKATELGFLSVLIGLIMDTSLEIAATESGPIVWYILGSVVYCVGLIFLKHYIESTMRNGDDYLVLPEAETSKQLRKRSLREAYRNSLVFFSALVGTVCLFLSPFSEQQFEDSRNFKAICFITFSFLLGISLLKAREIINVLATKCCSQYVVKGAVKISLFAVVSMVIFMTKYPRFKVHAKYKGSCKDQNGKKVISQRNQYDVYSTGSFSLFALTLSSDKEQAVKLGLFTFLVELTMDSSIELLGNEEPSRLFVLFAALYCTSLILVKCYLDSLILKKDDSTVPSGRDRTLDELPLIEEDSREEKEHGNREINNQVEIITESGSVRVEEEETNNGYEPSTSVPMDEKTQLLNRRERNRARRREKAKRDKARMKEKRGQEEDLWISLV